jgi:hypothetical protein
MQNFPNTAPTGNRYAHPWKISEKFKMVEKSCTKPLGSYWVVGAYVVENDF